MKYKCSFTTTISVAVVVEVEAPEGVDPEDWYGEEVAAEKAWDQAEQYLQTLLPSSSFGVTSVGATLDGAAADEVVEVAP